MTNAEPESLTTQVTSIRDGERSPVELVEAALDRIDRNAALGAFVRVFAEHARSEARRLADLDPIGPLHGVPIAIKDIIAVDGAPTEADCAAFSGRTPEHQATVVSRLQRAGAIVVGKTHTHELAYGTSCPASHNPWDPTRMTGGSSGGNGAAVASEMVAGSVGTDTGGSVRIPASYCGLTALKPTTGAVPRDGVYLLSQTFDTVGPMARTAADCRLMLEVMAGRSRHDPYSVDGPFRPAAPVERMRLGVPSAAFHENMGLDPRVGAIVDAAVEVLTGLVGEVVEVAVPHPHEAASTLAVVASEPCRNLAETRASANDLLGPDVRALLDGADRFTAIDVAAAHEARIRLQAAWTAAFDDGAVDAVIAPITPNHVPVHGATELDGVPLLRATTPYCLPVNAAWLPAIALLGGLADDGLPVGFQLIGPHWSDLGLAALGCAFQGVTDHHRRPAAP